MLSLRQLHAFVTVAEEGHITRAAERLGVQQPPLSRMLRGMETQLGVRLLHRLPRGVRPTEAGTALLEEARAVLGRAAGVEDALRRAARGEQGRLAVGFTSSAALHPFVPAALRAFYAAWPAVKVELDEAGTAELVDAILQGRLDAAFVRSSAGMTPGLVVDEVLDEEMVAALPSGHALAVSTGALNLTDLATVPFVLYRRASGPGLYDAILAACRAAGFSPVVAQEAPRLPATLSLVAAGLGVSVVPASMQRLALLGVTYRALGGCPGLSAPLRLVLRRSPSPTAARFRAEVKRLSAPPSAAPRPAAARRR